MKIKKSFSKSSALLFLLSAFILCGIIIGAISATYISGDTATQLINSLSDTKISGNLDLSVLLPKTILNIYKYPIILFLLGFSVLGVILIPITLLVKGFFLSFTIGSIITLYGSDGIIISLGIFGIQSMILIPCMLIISNQSMHSALAQGKLLRGTKHIGGPVFSKDFFRSFLLCAFLLAILIILEIYVTPILIDIFKN